MFHEATKLILKEGTTFDLFFKDCHVKRYDILSLADKFPQLNALKDRKLFLKGTLPGWGDVVWNDELDIDAESVYYEGIDVTDEYDTFDIINASLGYQIKDKRLEYHYSQEEAAKRIGIDQSDLSKIEKGNANPSLKMICKIAKGLNAKIKIDFK